jgi:hypothetical protein
VKIFYEFNFISEKERSLIIEFVNKYPEVKNHAKDDDCVRYYSSDYILCLDDFVYGVLFSISERVRIAAEEMFGLSLDSCVPNLFKTEVGHKPEEHADNVNMDGSHKDGCSNFVVSSIVYFNDDFLGGELVFPKLSISYKPIARSCVLFPSGIDYSHYVDNVKNGYRLVLPLWFEGVG